MVVRILRPRLWSAGVSTGLCQPWLGDSCAVVFIGMKLDCLTWTDLCAVKWLLIANMKEDREAQTIMNSCDNKKTRLRSRICDAREATKEYSDQIFWRLINGEVKIVNTCGQKKSSSERSKHNLMAPKFKPKNKRELSRIFFWQFFKNR